MDSEGEIFVKLLDFGIAKRAEDSALNMTGTGTMVGTPYFMSPEQVMSAKDADFHADLWSLAIVAYNALTGRVPFFAETLGALCVAIHSGHHDPVTLGRPELPKTLDGWFQRALARDPAARFASAKEMAVEFARAAGSCDRAHREYVRLGGCSARRRFHRCDQYAGFRHSPSPMPTPAAPNTLFGATVTHAGTVKSHKLVALVERLGALVFFFARGSFSAEGESRRRRRLETVPTPVAIGTTPPRRAGLSRQPHAPACPRSFASALSLRERRIERQVAIEPSRRKSSAQPAKTKPSSESHRAGCRVRPNKAPTTPKKGKDYGF